VRFGGVQALSGLGLRLEAGQILGMIGPNGAGKTTCIDAIAGNIRRHGGTVRLNGARIDGWTPARRAAAGLGRSFQSLELFEDMTVLDNIRTAADMRDRRAYVSDLFWTRRQPLSDVAAAAIDEFRLREVLDHRPSQLSYAQRRLVGLARSVAATPSILLLDEPCSGLDDIETREMGHLVTRLAREWRMGVLVVEHDVELVMRICDRILALDFGETIGGGTPAEIRKHPRVISAYLGEADEEMPLAALTTSGGAA
jgi:sulfate-transporting ATPase